MRKKQVPSHPFRMIVPEGTPIDLNGGKHVEFKDSPGKKFVITSIKSVKTIKAMGTEIIGMCRELKKKNENTVS